MEHKCNRCGKPILIQLSKRWICRDCKKRKEKEDYHKKYKDKRKLQFSVYYRKNREKMLAQQLINGKKRHRMLRKLALKAYGNKCECCGETKIEFLCIDHINGGGNFHRRKIKNFGTYYWLKVNKYPKGFRVLCHNCNSSLGFYGYCPHQSAVKVKEAERFRSNRDYDNG